MKKKILAVIITLIIVLASVGVIIIFTSNQQFQFKSSSVQASGIVTDFNQAYSLYKNNSPFLKNVSFVVYNGVVGGKNTLNKSIVDALEYHNITLLYEIMGNTSINKISEISKMDFQGVYFNGNISDYSISSLNNLIDKIKAAHGITAINGTLMPYIFNVSMINYYFIDKNNFTSLLDYLNSTGNKNIFPKIWINVNNSSIENLTYSIELFSHFGIRYFSVDFGDNSLSNIWMILLAEEKIDHGPGIIPSKYIIEGASNFIIGNDNIYVEKSLGVFTTNNSISFLDRIVGYNLSVGYEDYSSSELNITFINVHPWNLAGYAINFGITNKSAFVYVALDYFVENGYDLSIQGLNFSIKDNGVTGTFSENYNFYHVMLFAFDTAGNGIIGENFYYGVSRLSSQIFYIDPITKSSWSVNFNLSSRGELLAGYSFGFLPEDGYIIIGGFTNWMNNTTDNTSALPFNYIISQENGTIMSNFTNGTIIPNVIFSQGNSLLYEIENSSGYSIMELNTSSLEDRNLLLSKSEIGGFMLYRGDLVISNGNVTRYHDGSIMWVHPAPDVAPSNFGYEFPPMPLGNNELLIGTVIDQESVSNQFYSQEFEIINASTGATLKTFYSNFTLIPVGIPPGLPPSPDVYYPVTYINGLLIYSTIFGKQALLVSEI